MCSILDEPFVVLLDEAPEAPPAPRADADEDPRADAAEDDEPLFRREVLAERQTSWLGTVLLTPHRSHRLFVWFAVLVLGALGGVLALASYSRKAQIAGLLVPRAGLVQVFAPTPGVTIDVRVVEGQEVRRGDPLVVLSREVESAALGATRAEVASRLAARRDSLLHERESAELLAARRCRSIAERLAALEAERAQLEREVALQRARVDLAARSLDRDRALLQEGLVSDQAVQSSEELVLDHQARLCGLERVLSALDRERLALEGELEELPLRTLAETSTLERTIAEVEQELAEAEAEREVVVPAPVDGTVVALQAVRGALPRPEVPLLTLLPAGSQLEAHLFTTSRSVGLLRPGQRVLLRYEAYPYQKHGHHDGVVEEVSRATVTADVPTRLDPGEPVYRVKVRLARQEVTALGRRVALQPGLRVEADVVIDRRRLFEWVLDPVYALARSAGP